MTDKAKKAIESCSTPAQVRKALNRFKLQIIRDDTPEHGYFSVWIDDRTRIYKPHKADHMKVQTWAPVKMFYSGAPMFSSAGLFKY